MLASSAPENVGRLNVRLPRAAGATSLEQQSLKMLISADQVINIIAWADKACKPDNLLEQFVRVGAAWVGKMCHSVLCIESFKAHSIELPPGHRGLCLKLSLENAKKADSHIEPRNTSGPGFGLRLRFCQFFCCGL